MTSSLFNNKVKRERESSFGSTVEWDGPEDAQYREDRRVKVMHRKSGSFLHHSSLIQMTDLILSDDRITSITST